MAWSPVSRLGFVLGLRALLAKELRSRSRGWRSMWLVTIYLGLLAGLICGFLAMVQQAATTTPSGLGVWLFSSLALGSLVLLAFITPGFTAGAISGERERRTLDLLLITRASPLGLVAGKLCGSLAFVLFLLVASLPGFALVYLYGGVPIQYLLMVFAVLLTTAVTHAALGLCLSALLRRTVLATVATYFVVLGVVFGVPFVSVAVGIAGAASGGPGPRPYGFGLPSGPMSSSTSSSQTLRQVVLPPSAYLMVSPVISLSSVLPSESSGGAPMVGTMMQMALGGPMANAGSGGRGLAFWQSSYFDGNERVVGFAPWVYHFAISWTAALLFIVISAIAVAPVKPWRAMASRRRTAKRLRASESTA